MKGFVNLGNTCYLNSGLQLIIRIKNIYNILNLYRNKDSDLDCVINFFDDYYKEGSTPLEPIEIKKLVGNKKASFNGYNQEDSEEFINCFIDLLDDKCKEITNDPIIISKHLECTINKSIKCKALKCLTISNTIEKISIMNLSINKDSENLNDCLIEYLRREKLEDDSMYFCEKCDKLRVASKRMEVKKLPENLLISLKRYDFRLRKINKEIDMPINWKGYKLKGIVFHSGSFGGGHYVYIGEENGKWYLFNDSFVSLIKNIDALNQYKNFGYIYHYEKNIN
jgi:ubiquitin carboxyl-terminal hydrolase 12/46